MTEDSSEELTVLTVKKGTDIWNDDTPEANDWKHPYVQHREYEQGSVVAVSDLTLDIDGSGVKLSGYQADIPAATAGASAAASTDGYMTGTQAYALALATLYLQ